ncbi:MAG: hypothetical protein LUH10_06540 [Tannerellaceae bacterium]|nr:hypothetical protein [Tannerellaceae bacterium]
MKKNYTYLLSCLLVLFTTLSFSCTDDKVAEPDTFPEEGTPLNLYVGFDTATRVEELPDTDAINDAGTNGLNHIGLYVYYTEDYNRNDLSQPYIRNMECRIENGKLIPILADGEPASRENIYIYDYMTLVAFYPYNAAMSEEDNWFEEKADEENYPITRIDYSQQTYIPYRGEVSVNPTTAFYIELTLYPKHTFCLEIILVSENTADFNDGSSDIKLLPAMDPVDNDLETSTWGKREAWYDQFYEKDNEGGGMHVRRYKAYIWQHEGLEHIINQNEVLYEDGNFNLLATEVIRPLEQRVYRYGYNFTTGESFIPTSENLINDAPSLQAFGGTYTNAYQVCDIDLDGVTFTPLSMISSVYDGGGHKISNLTVNSTSGQAGLFSRIQGNSYLKNINLVNPVITVNSSADTCYVGALCGRVNNALSEQDMEDLYASILLPDNLSEVVKEALIAEILAGINNSQSQIISCRVENPVITVTGTYPRVGTVCGSNGDRQGGDSFRGSVWDTYSLDGTLSVNVGTPDNNAGAEVGGFCGLNEFFIGRAYTTIQEENISAIQNIQTGTDQNNQPIIEQQNIYQGFTNQGTLYTTGDGAGITDCYAVAPDTNTGVSQMPGAWPPGSWVAYTGIWPINTSSWTNFNSNKFWYQVGTPGVSYPVLQWERR